MLAPERADFRRNKTNPPAGPERVQRGGGGARRGRRNRTRSLPEVLSAEVHPAATPDQTKTGPAASAAAGAMLFLTDP